MCFIALSRSLASSVFPWFPVHVCWQKLLVLVSCPVMCNGDVVGLGPFYSPQRSAAWAAVRPDRPAFSSSAGVRCGTYLKKHYIMAHSVLRLSRPYGLQSCIQFCYPSYFFQLSNCIRWWAINQTLWSLMRIRYFCLFMFQGSYSNGKLYVDIKSWHFHKKSSMIGNLCKWNQQKVIFYQ